MLTFEFPNLIAFVDRMGVSIASSSARVSPNIRPGSLLRDIVLNPRSYAGSIYARIRSWGLGMIGPDFDDANDGEAFTSRELSAKELEKRAARLDFFYKSLSVLGAVGFFVGYIIVNGIIRIEVVNDDADEVVIDEPTQPEEEDSSESKDGESLTADVHVVAKSKEEAARLVAEKLFGGKSSNMKFDENGFIFVDNPESPQDEDVDNSEHLDPEYEGDDTEDE